MAAAEVMIDSVDVAAEAWCTSSWRVVEEQLSIDLRNVGEDSLAWIEAVYTIQADSQGVPLDLVFVAAQHYGDSLWVFWDGDRMKVEELGAGFTPPVAFELPVSTPDLKEKGANGRLASMEWEMKHRKTEYFRFGVSGGTGTHEVRVRYLAQAAVIQPGYKYVNRFWQLAYTLSPAKTWGSFGKLDIEILLPDGYGLRSNLELKGEGNAFRGSFEGIPADHLLMTFGLGGVVSYTFASSFSWMTYLPLALVCLLLLYYLVRRRWRLGKRNWPVVVWLVLSILGWSLMWNWINVQAWHQANYMLDGQINPNFLDSLSYGSMMATILTLPLTALIFTGLHLLFYVLFRWRERKRKSRLDAAA